MTDRGRCLNILDIQDPDPDIHRGFSSYYKPFTKGISFVIVQTHPNLIIYV